MMRVKHVVSVSSGKVDFSRLFGDLVHVLAIMGLSFERIMLDEDGTPSGEVARDAGFLF